ncbi:cytochrome c-type biogenesis protein CcmH, partial [Micromonospora sp. MH33]|uniref:cytochrome c-type biogenesis protein n=2 Tax=Micromonospora TaxID=1873 RepID=UPI000D147AFA
MTRRLLVALALAALVALAVAGLVRSAASPDRADRATAIAAGLRCPACQGESVADSRSPIAASMRQVIADQVAQGRSPREVRRWFVDRYGEEVLAQPPLRGPALLLWAVPAVALLGAGAGALRTLRPRRPDGERRRPDGGSTRG